jgi:rhodanese-related sulfurtransferase
VVRATVTDGIATVSRNVNVGVSPYGGGAVAGTSVAPTPELSALMSALPTIPANGGNVTAVAVFNAFAAISGTTQGAALTWAQRPYDVIDIRDAASFAAGHIPGAINVPLQELPDVLLAQPYFPSASAAEARRVLVAGYSQGDGSVGAILVTAGRFAEGPISTSPDRRAFFLAHGMATWTFDKAAAPYRWDDDLGKYRFEWTVAGNPQYVEAGGGTFSLAAQPSYEYPNVGAFNAATTHPMKRVLVRAREWTKWALQDAAARGLPRSETFVSNWGFYKKLRDTGAGHRVVSAQSDAQWNATRAIGAFRGITPTNATQVVKLDPDPSKPILWHCFSNTGAVSPCFQAAMLGYPARTVMYGITGAIARDTAGIAAGHNTFFQNVLDSSSGGNDFPISKSSADPESLDWARPTLAGCVACHRNYGAHYTEVVLRPFTAPVPEVASEGEG